MSWNMHYHTPAPDSDKGWELESLPLGNGYMGVNMFGDPSRERLQITVNSLHKKNGLSNFAELRFDFPHEIPMEDLEAADYERNLCLDNAEATVRYQANGSTYTRTYFASYPDKILAMKFTSDHKDLELAARIEIPYCENTEEDVEQGSVRYGNVEPQDDKLIMSGVMEYYNIKYYGELCLLSTDGDHCTDEAGIHIQNATEAVFAFAGATNYKLCPTAFLEEDPKKKAVGEDPATFVPGWLADAAAKTWDQLETRHIEDYQALFGRVKLDLGATQSDLTVPELLENCRNGIDNAYLEGLYFQFGRYLLIASSRPGCLPANLQGIWNVHKHSPWGSGYWFNINIQMNYWPAFSANLAECFEPTVDLIQAFLPAAEKNADRYVKENLPENFTGEGDSGWCVGTAVYPYMVSGVPTGSHSGPGTGGLTSKLFWEYYDFTRDENVLKNVSYPLLQGMSRFLTRSVREYDGKLLAEYSASPEQTWNGPYVANRTYIQTIGCGFDQQMIEENGADFLKAAALLGQENPDVDRQREQIDKYDPIQVGWDGQIKEYREERMYCEKGETNHRHLSQLMALVPGTRINSHTEAWLDAAINTLNYRTDHATGWALANRFNAWARTGDGNRSRVLYLNLLRDRTNDNLWDMHPPYQIDGNLGGCAAVAEMLLQSHEGDLHILPSLPDFWQNGSFEGLCARGAFEVGVTWSDMRATKITILSKKGNPVTLHYPQILGAEIKTASGEPVAVSFDGTDFASFETAAGETYVILPKAFQVPKIPETTSFTVDRDTLTLTWDALPDTEYTVLRALESEANYTVLAEHVTVGTYQDTTLDFSSVEVASYKVVPNVGGFTGRGAWKTINHATELELAIHRRSISNRFRSYND